MSTLVDLLVCTFAVSAEVDFIFAGLAEDASPAPLLCAMLLPHSRCCRRLDDVLVVSLFGFPGLLRFSILVSPFNSLFYCLLLSEVQKSRVGFFVSVFPFPIKK